MPNDAAAGASSTPSPGRAIALAALTAAVMGSWSPGRRLFTGTSGACRATAAAITGESTPSSTTPRRRPAMLLTSSSTEAPLSWPPAIHTIDSWARSDPAAACGLVAFESSMYRTPSTSATSTARGGRVLVHRAVPVDVVLGQVEHDGRVRGEGRGPVQLEARQLHGQYVVARADRVERRVADVPAGHGVGAGGLEDRFEHAGGGRLAVGAGDHQPRRRVVAPLPHPPRPLQAPGHPPPPPGHGPPQPPRPAPAPAVLPQN